MDYLYKMVTFETVTHVFPSLSDQELLAFSIQSDQTVIENEESMVELKPITCEALTALGKGQRTSFARLITEETLVLFDRKNRILFLPSRSTNFPNRIDCLYVSEALFRIPIHPHKIDGPRYERSSGSALLFDCTTQRMDSKSESDFYEHLFHHVCFNILDVLTFEKVPEVPSFHGMDTARLESTQIRLIPLSTLRELNAAYPKEKIGELDRKLQPITEITQFSNYVKMNYRSQKNVSQIIEKRDLPHHGAFGKDHGIFYKESYFDLFHWIFTNAKALVARKLPIGSTSTMRIAEVLFEHQNTEEKTRK